MSIGKKIQIAIIALGLMFIATVSFADDIIILNNSSGIRLTVSGNYTISNDIGNVLISTHVSSENKTIISEYASSVEPNSDAN